MQLNRSIPSLPSFLLSFCHSNIICLTLATCRGWVWGGEGEGEGCRFLSHLFRLFVLFF